MPGRVTMTKKQLSTYEREMQNVKFKKAFEKEHKELLAKLTGTWSDEDVKEFEETIKDFEKIDEF